MHLNKETEVVGKSIEDTMLYLSLRKPEGFEYSPGQFIKITATEEYDPKERFYSLASIPSEPNLMLGVRLSGRFPEYLKSLNVGDKVLVSGPYGHFSTGGAKKVIFCAGGAGIVPILSLIKEIEYKHIDGDFTLFFSNRKLPFPFQREIEKVKKTKIILDLTHDIPEWWKGEKGLISKEMVERNLGERSISEIKEYKVLLCGPQPYMKAVEEIFTKMGLDKKNIIKEVWG